MIRVGFVSAYNGEGWMGGTNYLSNLLHAIRSVEGRRIEPVLMVPPGTPDTALAGFPDIEVIRTGLVEPSSRIGAAGKIARRVLGRNVVMERLLRSKGISLLSHSIGLGRNSAIPSICWVPDFQHRRLPEFFTAEEIRERDAVYKRLACNASRIVLSSFDARRDLESFAPGAIERSRVLHFVSGFGGADEAISLAELRARYKFEGGYFHVPNQFWVHKNHRIVIDALALLRARGRPALVLATGHPNDHRNPGHFKSITDHARSRAVQDSFRVLGLVPYEHLHALIRHSMAVINPSFFEGWSTTVEEAKSLGKQVLLSDIPVHREQAPARAIYFPPASANDLADAMERVMAEFAAADEERHRDEAASALTSRFQAFGRQYEAIALETMHRP
ncbi:MAG TPA: glycosyltransferase family 1 protein [Vineibacter sp.]|nr:glycosyltransferase family 1 protein [Vineibacter sp.]